MLKLGVVGTSRKENERRVAIHPDHLARVPEELRKHIVFEKGYGEPFNMTDAELTAQSGGLASRKELLEHGDMVIVLPKPLAACVVFGGSVLG